MCSSISMTFSRSALLRNSVCFSGTLEAVQQDTKILKAQEAEGDSRMIKALLARKLVTLNDRELTGLEILELVSQISHQQQKLILRKLIFPNLLVAGLGLIHPALLLFSVMSAAVSMPLGWKKFGRVTTAQIQTLVHRPQDLSREKLIGALRLLRAAGLMTLEESQTPAKDGSKALPSFTCRLSEEGRAWLVMMQKASKPAPPETPAAKSPAPPQTPPAPAKVEILAPPESPPAPAKVEMPVSKPEINNPPTE